MVGALGKFHRIPGDLDVLYDKRNEERINRALEDKRYKRVSAGNPQNLFPKDLPRYIKGSQIIEPRKADFSGEEIFITLKAPIPLMPAPLRPTVRLKFGKEMSKSITYRINGVVFKSLSKEALWVGLNTIRIFKRKDDMRLNLKIGDQELLTPTINKRRIDSIYLILRMVPRKPKLLEQHSPCNRLLVFSWLKLNRRETDATPKFIRHNYFLVNSLN